MNINSPGTIDEFKIEEPTRDLKPDFDENETTGNFTKRPLTYEEFTTWKRDEMLKENIPVWLCFYEKFYSIWMKNDSAEDVWIAKLKEISPDVYKEIIATIDEFNKFNDGFEADKSRGRIATNADRICMQVLLIDIQPILYKGYEEARKYVDDDRYLFLKDYKPPLTFEEFCKWEEIPSFEENQKGIAARHDNFYLKFCLWGNHIDNPAIKKIREEIPDIFSRLSDIISNFVQQVKIYIETIPEDREKLNMEKPDIKKTLDPLQGDLYRAYLVARKYADYDYELFS
jgi:hypothetical protein